MYVSALAVPNIRIALARLAYHPPIVRSVCGSGIQNAVSNAAIVRKLFDRPRVTLVKSQHACSLQREHGERGSRLPRAGPTRRKPSSRSTAIQVRGLRNCCISPRRGALCGYSGRAFYRLTGACHHLRPRKTAHCPRAPANAAARRPAHVSTLQRNLATSERPRKLAFAVPTVLPSGASPFRRPHQPQVTAMNAGKDRALTPERSPEGPKFKRWKLSSVLGRATKALTSGDTKEPCVQAPIRPKGTARTPGGL